MSPAPILEAPLPIPPHAAMAIAAFFLGLGQLLLPKGTPLHRIAGWTWVLLMAAVALTGLSIFEIRLVGPFSPIHLLSLLVLWSLWQGVAEARRGDIAAHRASMRTLFLLSLVVAGAFTFLPGRRMHQALFGASLDQQVGPLEPGDIDQPEIRDP
jgi:uncharacterized membrane protein